MLEALNDGGWIVPDPRNGARKAVSPNFSAKGPLPHPVRPLENWRKGRGSNRRPRHYEERAQPEKLVNSGIWRATSARDVHLWPFKMRAVAGPVRELSVKLPTGAKCSSGTRGLGARADARRSAAELRAALKDSLEEETAGKGRRFDSAREAIRWLESWSFSRASSAITETLVSTPSSTRKRPSVSSTPSGERLPSALRESTPGSPACKLLCPSVSDSDGGGSALLDEHAGRSQ
jgi:hypothetical protein